MMFNPFSDSGITNFEQYKLYPFLVFGALETAKNRIGQQIKQIKNKHFFGERLIILGERGIGKTSTLCFIKDLLDQAEIKNFLFSRLLQDPDHFEKISGEYLAIASEDPIYILIDFPDTVENKQYRRFLEYLWSILTSENYNKINLIFALNKSHFEKSFTFSEIFGKFLTIRLEKLSLEETEELIESRLKLVNKKLDDIFNSDVLELIFNFSKGIPRNIISACSLLVDCSNGNVIDRNLTEKILKEKYFEQVINDRVPDLELKRVYKQMTSILENDFKGIAKSQEDYIKRTRELTGLGRNSILKRINDLTKFGIFVQHKGGYNRINKIISFN